MTMRKKGLAFAVGLLVFGTMPGLASDRTAVAYLRLAQGGTGGGDGLDRDAAETGNDRTGEELEGAEGLLDGPPPPADSGTYPDDGGEPRAKPRQRNR